MSDVVEDGSEVRGSGRHSIWTSLPIAVVCYLAVFALQPFYLRPLGRWAMGSQHEFTRAGMAVSLLVISLSLGAGIWVTYAATARRVSTTHAVCAAIGLLGFAALLLMAPLSPTAARWLGNHHVPWSLYGACGYLALALGSSALGKVIALAFRDRNLAPAGIVAGGLVDLWGVYSPAGTTRTFVHSHPAIHQHLSVTLPSLGPMNALVGPGDYIFIGIIFALAWKFDLKPPRTALWIWVLLSASMAGVMLFNWSVPAVAPMAVAVLLPNAGSFRYKRSEAFAMVYVGGLLATLAVVWWALHRPHP